MHIHELISAGVRKPARYVGGEYFPLGWKPPEPRDLKVALIYPDTYEIGMSNTGIRILYCVLRGMKGVYVDLAFAPWPDMENFLRSRREPLLSRHGQIPLAKFDVLGFSLQYELNYSNVLTILDLARIPIRAVHRTDRHPIVIAGGPCTSHPEPVAPFFDAFLIGDGEDALPEFLNTLLQFHHSRTTNHPGRRSRRKILESVARVPGVYVPSLPVTEVRKRTVRDLDRYLPFNYFPVPALETVFDRLSLELARGCWQGCRFCEAGFTYRPPRERTPEALLSWASDTLSLTGLSEISLASLSTADYSQLVPLARELRQIATKADVSVTISSLRAYGVEEEVLNLIGTHVSDATVANRQSSHRLAVADSRRSVGPRPHADAPCATARGHAQWGLGVSSLTLAPEAGSQRLRNVINKNVTREQLLAAIERIAQRGINRVKLYFMLGLPTETNKDLDELCALAWDCAGILKARFRGKAALVVSCSLFVPRPHTPFQWEGMATLDELDAKLRYVRRALPRKGIQLKWHNPDMSWLEGVLTRGDRSLADVIEYAWRLGARFDSWDELLDIGKWREAFAAARMDGAKFLAPMEPGAPLPWEHIQVGVSRAFLLRERERALQGKPTPPCDPFRQGGVCYSCGAECPLHSSSAGNHLVSLSPATPQGPSVRTLTSDVRSDQAVRRWPRRHDASPCETELLLAPGTGPLPSGVTSLHRGNIRRGVAEYRIRLTYRKVGTAILLGHLDLMRNFVLVLRRCGLRLARSQGFNPRPLLYFPPPLPLGWYGLEEKADVMLAQEAALEVLVKRFNEVSIPGLELLSAEETNADSPPIAAPKAMKFAAGLVGNGVSPSAILQQWALDPPPGVDEVTAFDGPLDFLPPSSLGLPAEFLVLLRGLPKRLDRLLAASCPEISLAWIARTRIVY